ncbi:MAG: HEAT repeat domain-containing protein [Gemmatimonadota bacterium]
MPVPLTALFASALHQVRVADIDAAAMDRALSLLTRAAGGTPVTFEILEGRFLVNDMPVSAEAPGVSLVMDTLTGHDTARLCLPGGLEPRHWREVAEIFASAAGLFPSPIHLIQALQAAVPGSELVSAGRTAPVIDSSSGELPADPYAMNAPGQIVGGPDLTTEAADRSELSTRLEPLLTEGRAAAEAEDYERLAAALIDFHALEHSCDDAQRSIIVRERRRTVSGEDLEAMVRLLPTAGGSSMIARAITSAGRDGVEALIEVLNGATARADRRAYVEALAAAPHAEESILVGLGSHRPELVAALADVAGRRHMVSAIPKLGQLLRHAEAEVRTAAWHALERIGTHEAFEALHGKGRR